MLPFCGYNMGSYFQHWYKMRKRVKHVPRFFHVNWFRLDENGEFLWPGFGENMRVLEWIVHRCAGSAAGHETSIGWVPEYEDFHFEGLDFTREDFEKVMAFQAEEWRNEIVSQGELFLKLFNSMPKELVYEKELLASRLS